MIRIRRSAERGNVDFGWLKSRHTFSFGNYHDARFMGFGPLRVINEDRVEPARGFGQHSHQNMEILSWVLDGALQHKDSLGTGAVIVPGEMQRMTAGTGITHSEFNDSGEKPVHFLQIWLLPNKAGIPPSYEEKRFPAEEKRGRLRLIASPDRADGSVLIHQDTHVYAGLFDGAEQTTLDVANGRWTYVHVARGSIEVNGTPLTAGDALKLKDAKKLTLTHGKQAEVIVFDLPAGN